MVEVEIVVEVGLVELSWDTHRWASDRSAAFLGDTTAVETDVVDIVLSSLRFKLSQALFSIAALSRCCSWNITRSVTSAHIVVLVEFTLSHFAEGIRILFAKEIVIGTRLHDREHCICFLHIPKLLGAWSGSTDDVGMELLGLLPVGIFDLFWGGVAINTQDSVVALLSRHAAVLSDRAKAAVCHAKHSSARRHESLLQECEHFLIFQL